MSQVLKAKSAMRRYGDKRVVDDVTLSIEPGGITALLGQSGAGKSTLLRLFAGLEPLDSGEVWLGDKLLSASGRTVPAEKRRIGLIFQDFALFPHMDAVRNVMFGLSDMNREDAKREALTWLDRLGLSSRAAAYPHELSGGEQQRVAIARALAPRPHALLMDEPFSGLDPTLRDSVRDAAVIAIRDAGIPALLVTHDAGDALASADTLAIMQNGRLLQHGSANDLYFSPACATTAAALGHVNRFAPGELPDALAPNSAEGTIIVRPEGVLLNSEDGVTATVISRFLTGPMVRLLLELSNGTHITALTPTGTSLNPSDTTKIALDQRLTFIFPSGAT